MKIKLNGKEYQLESEQSVSGLLADNEVTQLEMLSVQLNNSFLKKGLFNSTLLKDGDSIDYIYFMGGGQ